MRPVLLVIAGPNGAGKTTVTARLREERWSGTEARLCMRTHEGQLRKIYGDLPEWVADSAAPLARHPQFVDVRAA